MSRKNILYSFLMIVMCMGLFSCATQNLARYYYSHQPTVDSIHDSFKKAYQKKPFSIEFSDKSFKNITIEIMTDSIKYIYGFGATEKRFDDTLRKYKLDVQAIHGLITQMQSIHCTWVNTMDYYTDETKHSLIFLSMWPKVFKLPFSETKYYSLTFFSQPQYFDKDGNLLEGRRRRRIRRINSDIFKRINDKVCYTVSDRFR